MSGVLFDRLRATIDERRNSATTRLLDALDLLRDEPSQAMKDAVYRAAQQHMRDLNGIPEGSDLDFLDREAFEEAIWGFWRVALEALIPDHLR